MSVPAGAMTLLLVMALAIVESPDLPHCKPGFYLESGECKPCLKGQYTDKPNQIQCRKHRICKKSEHVQEEGNATRNRVCTCLHGGREYYNYDDEYGFNCRNCTENLAFTRVMKPRYQGDVGCCSPGMHAYRLPAGKLLCLTTYSPDPAPTNPPYGPPSQRRPRSQRRIYNDSVVECCRLDSLWNCLANLGGVTLTVRKGKEQRYKPCH